jgi:hypothetical protein
MDVSVRRDLLPAPTIDKPDRKIYMIEYRAGELPPHFIRMEEKEWTAEKEAAAIKADIKRRMETPSEIIKI